LAYAVLTLEEALSTFEMNKESQPFNLKLNAIDESRVIRIRKTEILIDGETRLLVTISDFNDLINYEKL
jgi:hypothetical protein